MKLRRTTRPKRAGTSPQAALHEVRKCLAAIEHGSKYACVSIWATQALTSRSVGVVDDDVEQPRFNIAVPVVPIVTSTSL